MGSKVIKWVGSMRSVPKNLMIKNPSKLFEVLNLHLKQPNGQITYKNMDTASHLCKLK